MSYYNMLKYGNKYKGEAGGKMEGSVFFCVRQILFLLLRACWALCGLGV